MTLADHRGTRYGGLGPTLAVAALAMTNLLVLTGWTAPLRAAVALPTAAVLPGLLALRALRLPRRAGWDRLLPAVGLSLAGLMAVGLLLGLLPGHPLTPGGCLLGLDCLVALLAAGALVRPLRPAGRGPVAGRAVPGSRLPAVVEPRMTRWPRWPRLTRLTRWPRLPCLPCLPRRSPGDERVASPVGSRTSGRARHRAVPAMAEGVSAAGLAVLLGAAGVGFAIAGARLLNRDGGAALSMAALGCASAALVAAALAARRRPTAAATGLYLLSLAVLLTTSLRGGPVTGHDIKIEYRVFTDTLSSGSWRPGAPFAGYHSCLSITVLPAFLARLLGIAPADVFRLCFQALFATAPVAVFLIARRFLPGGYAILAAGLFVAFPTFVNDMPMLNRQEIALLFFAVAVLGLLDTRGSPRSRFALFAVSAAGLTVSHYSTTYLASGLLLGGWLLRQVRCRLPASGRPRPSRAHATLGLPAALLIAMAIGWSVGSGSAAALGSNLYAAAAAVASHAGVYSGATGYSPVGEGAWVTDAEALERYSDLRERDSGGEYPPGPGCRAVPIPADVLAPTGAGGLLGRIGVGPAAFNAASRTGAVAVFEGGALLGGAVLALRNRPYRGARTTRRWAGVMPELTVSALALLAATVLAPQLSDSYGLLRLYQQQLVILAPGVVLAAVVPLRRLCAHRHRVIDAAVGMAVVGCLLTTSGLVPKLTGGAAPQLNLSNAGPYYRSYYTTPPDIAAMRWVGGNLDRQAYVVADTRDSANLRAFTPLYPLDGLVPGAVPPAAYVVVDTPDGRTATGVVALGDRFLRYTFPLDCVTAGRPLLSSIGPHRVYGPLRAP